MSAFPVGEGEVVEPGPHLLQHAGDAGPRLQPRDIGGEVRVAFAERDDVIGKIERGQGGAVGQAEILARRPGPARDPVLDQVISPGARRACRFRKGGSAPSSNRRKGDGNRES